MRRIVPVIRIVLIATILFSLHFSAPLPTLARQDMVTCIIELTDYTGRGETSSMLTANQHRGFLETLKNDFPAASVNFEYSALSSGFSVNVAREEINSLASLPGVEHIYFTKFYYPVLFESVESTRAKEAWDLKDGSGQPLTGKDVLVGIVDSGISYDHPSLSGGFNPGSKVCVGYDFANMDDDPMPETGHVGWHGTHCAGIVAGSGLPGVPGSDPAPSGIAPDARLGAYKVFGKSGGARNDRVMAAIERAYKDGCKVISLSLGSNYVWADEPVCKLIDRVVENGVVVVAAAGNEGDLSRDELPYKVISPGGAKNAICVGAVDDSQYPHLVAGNVDCLPEYLTYSKPIEDPITGPLVFCGLGKTDDVKGIDLKGKIALIKRGDNTFFDKAVNAQSKGALACIIFNNEQGDVQGTLGSSGVNIPIVGVSSDIGEKLNGFASTGNNATLDVKSKLGLMAGFSSQGPTNDFRLKPDVSAPGVNVLSAVGSNSYVKMSGTSMATPMVSGACAILIQAHPEWTPFDVRSAIINYAVPQKDKEGNLHPVLSQGTGRIDIVSSIGAKVLFSPTSIDLGHIKSDSTASVTVRNTTKTPLKITVTNEPEGGQPAKIDEMTLKASESRLFTTNITPDNSTDGAHTGYLVFDYGGSRARVAYLYFTGDRPDPPTISNVEIQVPAFSPNGDKKGDYLNATVSLNKMIDGFELDLTDTNNKILTILDYSYGTQGGGMWNLGWDGSVEGTKIEDGVYRIHLYTLATGRDPREQANWEHFGPIEFMVTTKTPSIQLNATDGKFYNLDGPVTLSGSIKDPLFDFQGLGEKAFSMVVLNSGKPLELGDNGSFSFQTTLKKGDNPISITAINIAGLKTTYTITLQSLRKAEISWDNTGITVNDKKIADISFKTVDSEIMIDASKLGILVDGMASDKKGQNLTFTLDKKSVLMMIGQPFVIVDGKASFCNPPEAKDNVVMVPLGALAVAFGGDVGDSRATIVWRGD